MWYPAAHKIIN